MGAFQDLTGKQYDRLTVKSFSHRDSNGKAYWLCDCKCGETTTARSDQLKCGDKKSCGCLYAKKVHEGMGKTHGMTGTPEHLAWMDMFQRCDNPNNARFKDYGGRGIRICEQWRGPTGFASFLTSMGRRPSSEYSLERVDNDGHYAPANCKWATWEEQYSNRRKPSRSDNDGSV